MGGLAAAKALSSYFEKVSVLERDTLPAGPEARTGTPQSQQVHVLLRGGLNALTEFFPDFETELEGAGAVRARVGSEIRVEFPGFDPFPPRDLDFDTLCMTRPLVEFVARRGVEQQGNIELQPRCRVTTRAGAADPLDGLAQAFFAAIQDVLAAPWSVAENDFIYAKTRGECPTDFQRRLKYGSALLRIAAEDAAVHRIMAEVNNLVKPPSALRDPQIASRVTALMAASA
jgi:hypothetical protein